MHMPKNRFAIGTFLTMFLTPLVFLHGAGAAPPHRHRMHQMSSGLGAEAGPYATKIIVDDYCPPTVHADFQPSTDTTVLGVVTALVTYPPLCPVTATALSVYQVETAGPKSTRIRFVRSLGGGTIRAFRKLTRATYTVKLGRADVTDSPISLLLKIQYQQRVTPAGRPTKIISRTVYTTILLTDPVHTTDVKGKP